MPSRRQEKVARVIKESVSNTITARLNDPRIQGFVSVTKVDISPDLRNADIFLSILTDNESDRRKTFAAIEHATRHIQAQLSHKMTSKYCPHLKFHEDMNFKKTLETLKLIDAATEELKEKDSRESKDNDLQ